MASSTRHRQSSAAQAELGKTIAYLRKAQKDLRDRHEQMRAIHAEMRSSNTRYRDLFDAAPIGYITSDGKGRIVEANRAAAELLAHASTMHGQLFEHFVSVPDRPRFLEQLTRCRRGRPARPFEVKLRGISGAYFPAQIILRSRSSEQICREVRITVVDLTELKTAQQELEAAKQTLEKRVEERTRELMRMNDELSVEMARRTRLEGELLEVSERERRRFGQDLHDETCQSLAGLAMQLAVFSRRLETDGAQIAPEMRQLAVDLNKLVEDTRRIAHGLHPVCLGGGLIQALEELAEATSQKVPCVLRAQPGPPLPPEVELALYRIAQEALSNVVKHAYASQVTVRLHRTLTRIALSVEDDGVGLPKSPPTPPSGMGLDILGYRARSIGAQLSVENMPKRGVRVMCHLPTAGLAAP